MCGRAARGDYLIQHMHPLESNGKAAGRAAQGSMHGVGWVRNTWEILYFQYRRLINVQGPDVKKERMTRTFLYLELHPNSRQSTED